MLYVQDGLVGGSEEGLRVERSSLSMLSLDW